VDLPFSSFCKTEKSVVPSAAGTTISRSMIANPRVDQEGVGGDLLEPPGPVIASTGVDHYRLMSEMVGRRI
jgi:hypothetical protein